ncbi:hypothetical protein [Rhizobium laguerreae]|uniref:Uncharacterized protein n=3 Tax=Rhizobium laguerreae TaxID=1076926 RepID=A0ABR6G345_9HYPH|nr:hypothetical protein [Rhizobium laguerreae]
MTEWITHALPTARNSRCVTVTYMVPAGFCVIFVTTTRMSGSLRVDWPGADAMGYDTEFAKRKFPEQALEIEQLTSRNESFRELCHDFSIADQLVQDWESSMAPGRDERYAEALELRDWLGKEIHTMLDLAKVVPFPAAR